jgi:hypothetical protein
MLLAESLPSLLGSKIGRMGDILRNTASTQIDDYQQRFCAVSEFYDLLFKDLIVDKCKMGITILLLTPYSQTLMESSRQD